MSKLAIFILPLVIPFLANAGDHKSVATKPFVETSALCASESAFAKANVLLCLLAQDRKAKAEAVVDTTTSTQPDDGGAIYVSLQAVCLVEGMAETHLCTQYLAPEHVYQVTPGTIFAGSWLGVDDHLDYALGELINKAVPAENALYDSAVAYRVVDFCNTLDFAQRDKLLCGAFDPIKFPITIANLENTQTVDAELDLLVLFGLGSSLIVSDSERWRLYSGIQNYLSSLQETIGTQFGREVPLTAIALLQVDALGFSDPRGRSSYNVKLSERRAATAGKLVNEVASNIGLQTIGDFEAVGQGERTEDCPKLFRGNWRLIQACFAGQRAAEVKLKFRVTLPQLPR